MISALPGNGDNRFPGFMEMSAVDNGRYRDAPSPSYFFDMNRTPGTSHIIAVLCVFENPVFLDRICRHLEKHRDITADICISVEDALHLMKYVPFDVIVTGYGDDPIEINRFLKTVRNLGNSVPFIYFTSLRNTMIEEGAREYGGVSVVEWEEAAPLCGFDDLYLSVKKTVAANRKANKSQNGVFL